MSRRTGWILGLVLSIVPLGAASCGPDDDARRKKLCEELANEAVKHLQIADEKGDMAAAQKGADLLDRAIAICPEDPDHWFKLTLAYVLLKKHDSARASLTRLERVIAMDVEARGGPKTEAAGDPRLLYARARISYTFGNNPRGALDDLKRLKARDPKFLPGPVSSLEFRCSLAYANLLAKSRDINEAIRHTNIAMAIARGDPQRQDIARRNLAQILRMGDRFPESQQEFEALVARYPRDAVLRYALASVLADQLKWDPALAQWKEVLALSVQPDTVDPRERDQLADARMRYAVTLVHAGRDKEGKAELLAFAKTNPNDARVWFQLGRAAVENWDDPDAAVEWLEKARSMDAWCERTLRLLLDLYSNARKDEGRAKALQQTLDSEAGTKARKKEMDRRRETRPDGTTGCE